MRPGTDPEYDVVIAGGGPVGLAAAVELGTRGVRCAVIEPRAEVSWARPRAKTTSARTMEHLRRWGLAEELRLRAPLPVAWSQDVIFCTSLLGREVTRISHCFAMDPARSELVAEGGQQVPQPLVEALLRDAVGDLANVDLWIGWTLSSLEESDDEVVASVVDGAGALRQLRGRYAIGSDGARSVTREVIGATYEGTTDLRANFNLVFSAPGLHERHGLGPAIQYWVLNPRVAGMIGPLDLGDRWWVIASGVDADAAAADPLWVVSELVGAPIEATVLSTDPWTARMALVDRYATRRTFLAGDAAHLNPPWGGHGFNTGVGDAVNLGWKLDAVLAGWGGPGLLASYEVERRAVARQTIAVAEANMKVLAVNLADDALDGDDEASRRRRIEAARRIQETKFVEFHSPGLVLGYRYDDSPITIADGTAPPPAQLVEYTPSACPGGRLPHRWLADGRSRYDTLGTGFSLLRLRPSCDPSPLVAAAARRGLPLVVLDCFDDTLSGPHGAGALLVRPDQHVAWRGEPSAHDALAVVDQVRGA